MSLPKQIIAKPNKLEAEIAKNLDRGGYVVSKVKLKEGKPKQDIPPRLRERLVGNTEWLIEHLKQKEIL
jgi:hypothetical protein